MNTLSAETFADINFRGFWPNSRKFMSQKILNFVIRASLYTDVLPTFAKKTFEAQKR